jgi:hypothetical protein
MAVNQTKLVGGGAVGESIVKNTWLNRFKFKIKAFNFHQRMALLAIILIIVIGLGSLIFVKTSYFNSGVEVVPVESQTINDATLNNALNKVQEDPSSVPSGKFHPELGDKFRSDTETNTAETSQ